MEIFISIYLSARIWRVIPRKLWSSFPKIIKFIILYLLIRNYIFNQKAQNQQVWWIWHVLCKISVHCMFGIHNCVFIYIKTILLLGYERLFINIIHYVISWYIPIYMWFVIIRNRSKRNRNSRRWKIRRIIWSYAEKEKEICEKINEIKR